MFLSESLTKGHYLNPHLSRWVPNIVLGVFGVGGPGLARAVSRARDCPFSAADSRSRRDAPTDRSPGPSAAEQPKPKGVVLVIRVPRIPAPTLGLLDSYISRGVPEDGRHCVRRAARRSSTSPRSWTSRTRFSRARRRRRRSASLLLYMTPQFVYFVIPIAALLSVLVTFGALSRSSELTVMKACGISLYRAALPVVVLSLMFSGVHLQPRAADPRARQPVGPRCSTRRSAAGSRASSTHEPPLGRVPRRRHLSLPVVRSRARRAVGADDLHAARPTGGRSPR